jgi:hypothetical protein
MAVNFGQCHDYSAIAIIEKSIWHTGSISRVDYDRTTEERYAVCFLERFNLGTPYIAVIERVGHILRPLGIDAKIELAVDAPGAG